jgi:hypothetical protein
MSLKSKEMIRDAYADVDFYDNDLTAALKKQKLVKGSDKK